MQSISDAPDLARSVYLLKKQRPSLKMGYWYGYGALTSEATPNWYESLTWLDEDNEHPIRIQFVKVASRTGYQWTIGGDRCEVNWLDPEPQIGSRRSNVACNFIEDSINRLQKRNTVDY